MPLTEYEAVARTPVDSSVPGDLAPVGRGRELQLALSERRIAELEAICKARHAGLQIVLAKLQAAEQRASEAERARKRDVSALRDRLRTVELAYEAVTRSVSWRCTAPLRWIARLAFPSRPRWRR